MTGSDPITDQLPDAPAPSDGTTLLSVLRSYESAGFDAQVAATDDGQVHCFGCGTTVAAHAVELHSLRRLEGASDPADMLAVAAVSCPACAANGVLVLNYGPDAPPGHAEVLVGMEDRRADDVLPAAQNPLEAGEA